jgi:hypothetical protein
MSSIGASVLLTLACAPAWTAVVAPQVVLGPEVDVSARFARPDLSQYQADLRCDPHDARRMLITCKVATSLSAFERRTLVYRSSDGGSSWAYALEPDSGDPDSVFDRAGRAYRSFIWNARGNHTGFRRSLDGGETWEPTQQLPAHDDHMHIVCDRSDGPHADSVYIAGRTFAGRGVTVSRSRDHGATFQSASIPMEPPLGKGFVYGPAVTARGSLVIPYTSGGTFLTKQVDGVATYAGKQQSVHILRSTDGGETFTQARIGDIDRADGAGFSTSPNLSQIAVGPHAGGERLYLAYPRSRPAACSQLLLVTSDDDGATWNAPRAIVDSTFPNGFSPSSCSVMVGKTGIVGVQWIAVDAQTTAFHLCFAASLDGGATFGAPVQVTDAVTIVPGGKLPMPTTMKAGMTLPGQPRSPGQDQLYADVDADGVFHLVWTDARHGDPMGNNPGYAIFTRTATVSAGR